MSCGGNDAPGGGNASNVDSFTGGRGLGGKSGNADAFDNPDAGSGLGGRGSGEDATGVGPGDFGDGGGGEGSYDYGGIDMDTLSEMDKSGMDATSALDRAIAKGGKALGLGPTGAKQSAVFGLLMGPAAMATGIPGAGYGLKKGLEYAESRTGTKEKGDETTDVAQASGSTSQKGTRGKGVASALGETDDAEERRSGYIESPRVVVPGVASSATNNSPSGLLSHYSRKAPGRQIVAGGSYLDRSKL